MDGMARLSNSTVSGRMNLLRYFSRTRMEIFCEMHTISVIVCL